MAKRVWILGAGFSRSLGGPLLVHLFTTASAVSRSCFFPRQDFPLLHDATAKQALEIYKRGCDKELGIRWNDPEEFLEKIDMAAVLGEHSATALDYRRLINNEIGDFKPISIAARRLLAAECSIFLRENDPSWERWRPYRKWANQLRQDDVIITFNYDLVPDILRKEGAPLAFQLPGQTWVTPPEKATVLKLHGSVNWKCIPPDNIAEAPRYEITDNPTYALVAPSHQIAIAGPGPDKTATVAKLDTLWQEAESHLRTCHSVVFIGYHFPMSDAEARDRLLSAMRKNRNADCQYKVILGRHSPDVEGLLEMLKLTVTVTNPHVQIRAFPLYGEEYLDCYEAPRGT